MNYWKVEKGNTINYVALFKGIVPEGEEVTKVRRIPSRVYHSNIGLNKCHQN